MNTLTEPQALTDEALRLIRVLVVARYCAQGVPSGQAYHCRLVRVCYRAWLRWKRRDEKAPGCIRPVVAGYRSITPAHQREIGTAVVAAIAKARGEA